MSKTKSKHANSFVEEGTVYWCLATTVLLTYLTVSFSSSEGILFFGFTIILAIVEVALAYFCWTMKKWAFLASTISAIVVAGLAYGILYSPVGDLLLLLQLQFILFSYRAYREPAPLTVQL